MATTMRRDAHDPLLLDMAEAFSDGRDPFSTEFLREHNVSLHDAIATSTLIGHLLRDYVALSWHDRMKMIVVGAATEAMDK